MLSGRSDSDRRASKNVIKKPSEPEEGAVVKKEDYKQSSNLTNRDIERKKTIKEMKEK